ncbi:class I SAM-dependent methyltransferase [Aeromicrobium ginsengisoli]|uniref:S-adenosyl-L-methionine-dependent methyltransferase n=1 Tax=Aeromicrobium ginsengisoli TaxID=363867 RepID=A0A5M4FI60_9ACTN|nr:class I SAM-dependent methyltransferase [Aeromicrobium ginsengisoli]KAA1399866.1 class I SAM-dependent methyltransferase [Aeromicrobium ginsengisoli]
MKSATTASRTAVLVCQGRAVADTWDDVERFADPTAARLLLDDEQAAVDLASDDAPPPGWGLRVEWEMLRATAEVIVPRTVAIDDALREQVNAQVVILGAGLDGRAWRMTELAGSDVFEVDHPASQQDKRSRARDLSPVARDVRFVPVDFGRDDLGEALTAQGHRVEVATTWVWEGVVPYLSRSEVEATMRVIGDLSAAGSRLIVNYQVPSAKAALGRLVMRAMTTLSRRPDPLAGEPTRSTWTALTMRELLEVHGYAVVRDVDLLTLATDTGRPVRQRRSLANGRVVVAELS